MTSSSFNSPLMKIWEERGFIYQATHPQDLDQEAAERSITAYVGFDATSDSLQVGNLLMLMMACWLQKTGHRVLALVGGGTTKIGDPSGKTESRKMLSHQQIQDNILGLKANISRILSFADKEGEPSAKMVDNADWLDHLGYIDFLREIGVHFSVNRMLTFDHVRSRLEAEQNLSFIEFNYSLLQAYDFVQLFEKENCVLQFGGSDQWGNIVSGVDLVRRMTGRAVYGLTCPLLTTASGAKMGKTADGAIWLDPRKTTPFDYWQFWRNAADQDVVRFLKLYTFLPLEHIHDLERLQGQEINQAKIVLADEATRILHGAESLEAIHDTVESLFLNRKSVGFSTQALETITLDVEDDQGVSLAHILKEGELSASLTQARQKIKEGAVKINDCVIKDEKHMIFLNDFDQDVFVLSLGKKYLRIFLKKSETA